MTCQPALEWEQPRDVDDDLDSLSGGEGNKGSDLCSNDLSEVEEMEAQMTPRGEAVQEDTTGRSGETQEDTTPKSNENENIPKSNKEESEIKDSDGKQDGDQGPKQDISLRRCVSASAILVHDKEGLEQEISLQLSHRLHLSPRSSFDHYDNKKRKKVYAATDRIRKFRSVIG